ncbi:CDP-diacylglycerol--glycerol-3-phosphate 3-phosphatidyltransferase [Cenarchaeum symbiosum A]|uniref:Archaetidylinositol phosphate synthase n=1 Tax=Cenarchaeum symbiosum (strain A) TaxID=414004 RepID=A0RXD7_CENSY|nr:CDP-diacylglycerol--glycerol-3-phosphate 3-phosphatidyltransferase [Cenarchaeum symbiosum A]
MLENLRGALRPALERMGAAFARTGLPPDFWTGAGLAAALAAALFYGVSPWYAAIMGGVLLLVSGFFDMVDGQVARTMGKASKRGAFLDSVLDRVAEVAVFIGIMAGGHAEPHLVILALSMSLLVSYTRARAESLGVKLRGIGIGERAERLLVIAILGMAGFMEWAVIIVIIIAAVTFVQRVVAGAKDAGA